jgi:hypothetical protein
MIKMLRNLTVFVESNQNVSSLSNDLTTEEPIEQANQLMNKGQQYDLQFETFQYH